MKIYTIVMAIITIILSLYSLFSGTDNRNLIQLLSQISGGFMVLGVLWIMKGNFLRAGYYLIITVIFFFLLFYFYGLAKIFI